VKQSAFVTQACAADGTRIAGSASTSSADKMRPAGTEWRYRPPILAVKDHRICGVIYVHAARPRGQKLDARWELRYGGSTYE
jgi:hypothetical protein